jgi:putative transcriptional regulator
MLYLCVGSSPLPRAAHHTRRTSPRHLPRRNRYHAAMRSILVALLAALAAPAGAQTVADGSLLVAQPALADPNFARSVVLVLRHDENGTLGVVINRVTSLAPVAVFPEFSPSLDDYPGTLYRGGPIDATRVLFLATGLAGAAIEGGEIIERLFVSADPERLPELAALADGTDGLRLYAGHAQWAPGQLAQEIATGSWRVVPGNADLVFSDPSKLWEAASDLGAELIAAEPLLLSPAATGATASRVDRVFTVAAR